MENLKRIWTFSKKFKEFFLRIFVQNRVKRLNNRLTNEFLLFYALSDEGIELRLNWTCLEGNRGGAAHQQARL